MGRGLYSEGGDRNNGAGGRGKPRPSGPSRRDDVPPPPGTFPGDEFRRPSPGEEQRRRLREAQLRTSYKDKDMNADQAADGGSGPDVRRDQYDAYSGWHKSEGHMKPPRGDARGLVNLKQYGVEGGNDDPDIQGDPDMRTGSLARCAALSVMDGSISRLDSLLSEVASNVQNLQQAAREILQRARQDGNSEAEQAAEKIVSMAQTVGGWIGEIDDNLSDIINATPEVEEAGIKLPDDQNGKGTVPSRGPAPRGDRGRDRGRDVPRDEPEEESGEGLYAPKQPIGLGREQKEKRPPSQPAPVNPGGEIHKPSKPKQPIDLSGSSPGAVPPRGGDLEDFDDDDDTPLEPIPGRM